NAKVVEDRRRQAEVSEVRPEPKRMIGLDRVDSRVLQLVSLQFGHQADAASFLIFIDHQSAAFLRDGPHGDLQLVAAVAAQRAEHLAGEALRVDAQQRSALRQIAHGNRKRRFDMPNAIREITLEPYGLKHAPPGRHPRGDYSPNCPGLRGSYEIHPRAFRLRLESQAARDTVWRHDLHRPPSIPLS